MKFNKTTYLHGFAFVTVVLALIRCATGVGNVTNVPDEIVPPTVDDSETATAPSADVMPIQSQLDNIDGEVAKPHRINSVPSYKESFPDSNHVHLRMAEFHGVRPVQNRVDAEHRKSELVYAAMNPYAHVDPLRESIPYLVPRAYTLLNDIGRAFYDSLYVKGVPLHQIIVTSVLRTEDDIVRLRRHNINASDNSAHRYGTTFDICYNRYRTVQTADEPRRQVRNDTLKWILSEVLRDMRESGRCYIKYEVKQGCFHITTR